ncbi:unnamed protein product [Macrosiphum euphorbiae]|uniref:Uncharacterized protein n=1 Tax=Macrosiphum euphorbiae TaxID=13131 RepID=A0AAV0VWC3_9HEMI|nr:unnamed protein product [Macrosiphum euphorbiae]
MSVRPDGVHILDEQFVERLIRVRRDGYGNGGQLELFHVPLVDGALDAAGTDDVGADATGTDAAYADDVGADATGTDSAATDAAAAATGGQRQRELLVVGPAAVVVLGQEVRALGLPNRPYRNAVSDVRVLVDGTDVDGRVDAGPGPQQVPDAPVQRIGQAAAHQVSLEKAHTSRFNKPSKKRKNNNIILSCGTATPAMITIIITI